MENLKALVYKGDLTPYQRALAQREFEGLIERLELYEKAVKNNTILPLVSESSLTKCDVCGCHPSVIIRTEFGTFCQDHARHVR